MSFARDSFGLTGESVVVGGMMCDVPCGDTREAAYRVYQMADPHQEHLLKQLLESRHQLATLCGFDSFAHRSV